MKTNQPAPSASRWRVMVPAVLLIGGTALCCGTACIAYGTAAAITAGAAAAAATISQATVELERNRAESVGSSAVPTVTADPASIAEALRPALPGGRRAIAKGQSWVKVTVDTAAANPTVYLIEAHGPFTLLYAQAFANFSNRLRTQLPGNPKFVVLAYDGSAKDAKVLSRMEVN